MRVRLFFRVTALAAGLAAPFPANRCLVRLNVPSFGNLPARAIEATRRATPAQRSAFQRS